jgi:hypothetical protein
MARLVLVLALILVPGPATASDWGGIQPGVTTVEQVRERYGPPSKESRPKVEGYDTLTWVYEGSRAPAGTVRLTVDFGLLTPAGYKPGVVRIFTLEPKPAIFGRATVFQGWGLPDREVDNRDGTVMFTWHDGLIVMFDKAGEQATTMIFSMPQPGLAPSAGPAPPRPQPGAPAPRP